MLSGIYSAGYATYFNRYNTVFSQYIQNTQRASPVTAIQAAVIPAAQPGTPVQPVTPVRQTPEVSLDKEGLLRYLENDPVAAIVRSRIQYPKETGYQSLSPEGAKEAGAQRPASDVKSAQEVMEDSVCQTCKQRKYQDGSDDPGVSFKNATRVAPEQAASAVRGHEYEHVAREQNRADREGRKVVDQSVTYRNAICPECGKVYVAGGETKTVTVNAAEPTPNGETATQSLFPGAPSGNEDGKN